jgi:ribonuclease P protein component
MGLPSFRFPKAHHLRSKADFERIYSRKCKAGDGILLLFADRNDLNLTRIGLSVSRKHGGAVARNRLKRLLREAFRLSRLELPTGLDLIAVPLDAEKAALGTYQSSLRKLTERLARRLESEPRAKEPRTH